MAYILIIMIMSGQPVHFTHIDGIRFDNEAACRAELQDILNANQTLTQMGSEYHPIVKCVPAAVGK